MVIDLIEMDNVQSGIDTKFAIKQEVLDINDENSSEVVEIIEPCEIGKTQEVVHIKEETPDTQKGCTIKLEKLEIEEHIIKQEELIINDENFLKVIPKPQYHQDKEILQCAQCPYGTNSKKCIENHVKGHSGERPFACTKCSYRSHLMHALKFHMKSHCTSKNVKLYKCTVCGKSYKTNHNFKCHMSTHTGKNLLQCTYCSYQTSRGSFSLKMHMVTHSDERPFGCIQCSYRSKCKQTLKIHMETHLAIRDEFKCTLCKRKFKYKKSLQYHLSMHTSKNILQCTQCTYQAPTSRNLKYHMITHSDEKPFACEFCGYRAKFKYLLTKHSRAHHNEFPKPEKKIMPVGSTVLHPPDFFISPVHTAPVSINNVGWVTTGAVPSVASVPMGVYVLNVTNNLPLAHTVVFGT